MLFVALSRVRHPEHLMLDDDFPPLFEILKQSMHPSFRKRQHWELMRAKFAKILRLPMRDPSIYKHPGTHLWCERESQLVEVLLALVANNPALDETGFERFPTVSI